MLQWFSVSSHKRPTNCELDPVPTWLVKQYINELSPFITLLFNASFCVGLFPLSLKCAIVTPALKDPTLDPSDLNNYCPISNLTFMSQLLKHVVLNQLNVHLQQFNILPELQSAYICCYSTETSILSSLSRMTASVGRLQLWQICGGNFPKRKKNGHRVCAKCLVTIDIVINSTHCGVTLCPAGMHCPAWGDAGFSSSSCIC